MPLPYTTPIDSLPSQMLSYKNKTKNNKKWGRDCIDALEQLGRRQYYENLRFIENYQMINGKFFLHQYEDNEGYKDMVSLLTQDFGVPSTSTLRHFDIINKVINHMTSKLGEFKNLFRVEEMFEDDDTNEYIRTQTDLMHKIVQANINKEIMARLSAQGIDPNKQDFQSEQEAMQYQKEIQDMVQALTPKQIQKYMETDWKSQGEIWADHQLRVDRQRYKMDEKKRIEFRDKCITARCFRHFFLTPDGYDQETWNPMNTFHHLSPDINWTQDGDYVGRIFYLTKADIIRRYGWKMEDDDLEALETLDKDYSNDLDFNGFPYKVYAPFEDFKAYDIITKNSGYDPINKLPMLGEDVLYEMTNNLPNVNRNNGLFRVTEVYWISQRKIGKYCYNDQFTGLPVEDLVDENFVIPPHVTQIKGNFHDGHEKDTIYWTWVDETWKGIKICFAIRDTDAIYLDIDRCDFQFKGDYNPYECKLPVCGRIFNNRNAQSMSLVDIGKPFQVMHNLCMNQMFQLLSEETGKFLVWDNRIFQTMKDWGGEDTMDKVMLAAKELHGISGDFSPQNLAGGGPGLPKEVDLTFTAQIMSRAKLAEFFEQRFLATFGGNPQMLGAVKTTDTATGIDTGMEQTSLTIQEFYEDFFEYEQRCLTMDLDIAQYVQSQKKDVTISYTKSDQSRVFIQMLGTELMMRNIHVYVVNSQEILKQLEEIKQYFIRNNTISTDPVDFIEVITANSPEALKTQFKEMRDKRDQKQQQMQQQQMQLYQLQLQQNQEKENRLDERNKENNETKIQVAEIMVNKPIKSNTAVAVPPTNNSLEYSKFNAKTTNDLDKNDIQRNNNEIQRERNTNDKLVKLKQLQLQEQKTASEDKRTRSNIRVAKIQDKTRKKK